MNVTYVRRLEKAVENALLAINKLKVENEQLRQENDEYKKQIEGLSLLQQPQRQHDQKVVVGGGGIKATKVKTPMIVPSSSVPATATAVENKKRKLTTITGETNEIASHQKSNIPVSSTDSLLQSPINPRVKSPAKVSNISASMLSSSYTPHNECAPFEFFSTSLQQTSSQQTTTTTKSTTIGSTFDIKDTTGVVCSSPCPVPSVSSSSSSSDDENNYNYNNDKDKDEVDNVNDSDDGDDDDSDFEAEVEAMFEQSNKENNILHNSTSTSRLDGTRSAINQIVNEEESHTNITREEVATSGQSTSKIRSCLYSSNRDWKSSLLILKSQSNIVIVKEIVAYVRAMMPTTSSLTHEDNLHDLYATLDQQGIQSKLVHISTLLSKVITLHNGYSIAYDIIQLLSSKSLVATRRRRGLSLLWVQFGTAAGEHSVNVESKGQQLESIIEALLAYVTILSAFRIGCYDVAFQCVSNIALNAVVSPAVYIDIIIHTFFALNQIISTLNQNLTSNQNNVLYNYMNILLNIVNNYQFKQVLPVDINEQCNRIFTSIFGVQDQPFLFEIPPDLKSQLSVDPIVNEMQIKYYTRKYGIWHSLQQLVRTYTYTLGLNNILSLCTNIIAEIQHVQVQSGPLLNTGAMTNISVVTSLLYSHQNTLLANSNNDTILSHYTTYWKQISTNTNIDTLESITDILTFLWRNIAVIFSTSFMDYDAHTFGWIVGESAKGITLSARLSTRLANCRECLTQLHLEQPKHYIPSAQNEYLLNVTKYWQLGFLSVQPELFLESCQFFDDILIVFRNIPPNSAMQSSENATSLQDKLTYYIYDLYSLICTVILETIYAKLIYSARGLLQNFEFFSRKSSGDLHETLVNFILNAPVPLSGKLTDTVCNEVFSSITSSSAYLKTNLPEEISLRMFRLAHRIPIYVINLQRRPDRYVRFLQMANEHNILIRRVDAVDGKLTSITSEISPLDVGLHWDSTLNAKFDTHCVVHNTVPLTPSERGCIASHIKTWRLIASSAASVISTTNSNTSSTAPIINDLTMNTNTSSSASSWVQNDVWSKMNPISMLTTNEARNSNNIKRWYIVCEDDALINQTAIKSNFPATIHKLIQQLPSDCDICYLGYLIPRGATCTKVKKKPFIHPTYLWQLHAYMLKPSSARLLLSHVPISEPVDNFIARLIYEDKIKAYAVKDQLFRQYGASHQDRRRNSDIRHSGNIANR